MSGVFAVKVCLPTTHYAPPKFACWNLHLIFDIDVNILLVFPGRTLLLRLLCRISSLFGSQCCSIHGFKWYRSKADIF